MAKDLDKNQGYASAAKKRTYKRVSIKHLFTNEQEQRLLTMITPLGGAETLGLDLTRYEKDADEVADLVASQIDFNNASYSLNKKAKKMLIFFDSENEAINFESKNIEFKSKKIKFSKTIEMEEDKINIKKEAEKIKNILKNQKNSKFFSSNYAKNAQDSTPKPTPNNIWTTVNYKRKKPKHEMLKTKNTADVILNQEKGAFKNNNIFEALNT
ncbi:hypothetical protein BB558_006812, partial [Smittium angustum]